MGDVRQLPETFVARSTIRRVVRDEVAKLMNDVLAEAIGRAIGNAIAEARDEIESGFRDALAQFCFRGTWSEGIVYKVGNFVSMGGQVYHCDHDCKDSRPGIDGNWSLAVKSGRDGRDGVAPPEQRTVRSHR